MRGERDLAVPVGSEGLGLILRVVCFVHPLRLADLHIRREEHVASAVTKREDHAGGDGRNHRERGNRAADFGGGREKEKGEKRCVRRRKDRCQPEPQAGTVQKRREEKSRAEKQTEK